MSSDLFQRRRQPQPRSTPPTKTEANVCSRTEVNVINNTDVNVAVEDDKVARQQIHLRFNCVHISLNFNVQCNLSNNFQFLKICFVLFI